MNLQKIGTFISNCRKEKGLTQENLAKKLNLTSKAISKWECGNGLPDVSIMLKLCEVLDINIMDLLSGEHTNTKLYKRKTEGSMIKKLTINNALRDLKGINDVSDDNIKNINDINKRINNVTVQVILKGIDIIENQGYYEVNMEVEDDTDEMNALLLSKSNDEIKEVINKLQVNGKYLINGIATINDQMLGNKLLIIKAIKKI